MIFVKSGKRLLLRYNFYIMKKVDFKNLFKWILVILCGFALGQLMLKSFTKLTLTDFHVYYYVGKAVMKYGMHPYSNYIPIYPYYFPPASLLLFWPLTLIPFYLAKIIFTVINSILLFLSIFLINKMLLGKIDYRFWLMLLLSLIFYPLRFTFSDGQFNVFILAIFTLGLYAFYKNKYLAGGVSLGLGIITKISPAIIVLYGILRKKFNLVMIVGITVISLSLLAEHFVRKDINYYYAKYIVKNVSAQSSGLGAADQSLLGFIKRFNYKNELNMDSTAESIVSYSVVAFLGLLFFVFDLIAKKGKYNLFIDYFILVTIGVIGTGLAWYHQYTSLILPLFGFGILVFTRFNKKYKYLRFGYIIGIILVYLFWFMDIRSSELFSKGFSQFIMFYGGVLLLIGLYAIKINQKWLVEENPSKTISFDSDWKKSLGIFFVSVFFGLNPFRFSEILKEGRDESRVKALDYMSDVLREKKVSFKVEESNSYVLSNRVGKGYIRFAKGEDSKVLDKMYILYEDPINNSTYNYSFKSDSGEDFELKAKLESRKYIDNYGDYYTVDNIEN